MARTVKGAATMMTLFTDERFRRGRLAAAAIAAGILLRFVVSVTPVWWLAWVGPLPLLVLGFGADRGVARWLVPLAALIATSANLSYYRSVSMPLIVALLLVVAHALLWSAIVLRSRRVIERYRAPWTVLAYPVLWTAADTLMARLLPDGNFTSLGYSQGDVLPVLQVTSLVGVAGLVFVLCLVPSTLAYVATYGRTITHRWRAPIATAIVIAACIGYGYVRLGHTTDGSLVTFGLVSIDDAIGLETTPEHAGRIRGEYDRQIDALVARGAQVIVLPEGIALLSQEGAARWRAHFAELALRNHVWLEVGIGIDDRTPDGGGSRVNRSWLFDPNGSLAADYQKHFMAPPERHDDVRPGSEFSVVSIAERPYGLAICKDMHFASLGRSYAERGAAVMLVPAWDWKVDAWLAERITATRGVESGYMVVRAARTGLLTINDPQGRVLASAASAKLPGSSLLATVRVPAATTTIYAIIGDAFGWLCVAGALALIASTSRRRRREW